MALENNSDIGVITAIFGNYDLVPPIPNGFKECVLISDIPIFSDWTNIVLKYEGNPVIGSKLPKFRPDLFCSTNLSVWMDANIRDPKDWLFENSTKILEKSDFGLFAHPNRKSVKREIAESRKFSKYDSFPLEKQYEAYCQQGFTDNVGLWACGVIARRHTERNAQFGNAWFVENVRWSIQDQISFSYLVWKMDFQVETFDEKLWRSPLKFEKHKK